MLGFYIVMENWNTNVI